MASTIFTRLARPDAASVWPAVMGSWLVKVAQWLSTNPTDVLTNIGLDRPDVQRPGPSRVASKHGCYGSGLNGIASWCPRPMRFKDLCVAWAEPGSTVA